LVTLESGQVAEASRASRTGAAGAAAAGAWHVLAHRTDLDSRGQARVLLRLVDDMLHETGGAPSDIAAIVAGNGPGTFTGVRIAVATARALALALSIPIVGVSTLSALAAEAAGLEGFLGDAAPDLMVPVVDARRGQLFYGMYHRADAVPREGANPTGMAPALLFVRTGPFAVCDRDALLSTVAPNGARTLIVGELGDLGPPVEQAGISLLSLQVRAQHLVLGQRALREPGEGVEGSRLEGWLAGVLSHAGASRTAVWKVGEPGSPEAVKPIYVRSPDADIHITKMRDPWADAAGER
jgi:tRNA threonylcarbamoyl adenosine modification protein YeaZ